MLSPQTQGGSDLTQAEGDLRSTECGRQGVRTGGAQKAFLHMCTAQTEGCMSEGLQRFSWTCLISDWHKVCNKNRAVSSEAVYRQNNKNWADIIPLPRREWFHTLKSRQVTETTKQSLEDELELSTVAQSCNPREAEAGLLRAWSQARLHREFQGGLDYIGRPCQINK